MPREMELFVPKEWSKCLHDKVNEPVDPDLFSKDELFAWLGEVDLCRDKYFFEKLITTVRPYHFMRCMAPTFVKNPRNNKVFNLGANLVAALYISDDMLENLSRGERIKVCNAFQLLEEEIGEKFPRFPCIFEMKQFLSQKNVAKQFQRHVLYWFSFSNDVAKSVLEVESFQRKEVKDYWKRLNMTLAISLEGVMLETTIATTGDLSKNIWKRLASTGAMTLAILSEAVSRAIGRIPAHLPLLNEMIFLESYVCMVINDIYSYNTDKKSENVSSVVKMVHNAKHLSGESEAITECVKSLNAVLKVMYKKIYKTKQENAKNQELCKMLETVGQGAVGYYFIHEYFPRYGNSPWRLSLVELEENFLKKWTSSYGEELIDEVKLCLIDYSLTAKKISDAIIGGTICMHSGLLLE